MKFFDTKIRHLVGTYYVIELKDPRLIISSSCRVISCQAEFERDFGSTSSTSQKFYLKIGPYI